MTRLTESYYTTAQKFVSKMWTPAKCLVLICATLFLASQGISYGHDVNPPGHNHIPEFVNEEGEYIIATDVYVSENLSNYLIGSVKAVDEDEDDTLTYSLDADSNYYSLMPGHKQSYIDFYTINSETGEVHIGSSGLDYDTYPVFSKVPPLKYQPVWIKVEDGNGGSARFAYQVLIADENDNAPVFSEDSQTLSINENEPSDTTVGTVSASDADAFAGDHTYSIETGNVPFTIESSQRIGTIKTTSVLDYEATSSYTLTVKVDDGFGTDTIDVTINITNDPSDDTVITQPPPPTSDPIPDPIPDPNPQPQPDPDTNQQQSETETQQNTDTDTDTQDPQTVPQPDPDTNQQQSETETQQNTDTNADTQDSQTVPQPSDPGQSTPDASTPAEPTPEEPPQVISKLSVSGQISFSEIMIASRGGLHSRAQWIEVYNNSDTEAVNLYGWKLEIEARDDTGAHRHVVIPLEDLPISANQTVLIATWSGRNSGDFPEDRIYIFFNHHSDEFEQNEHRNMVLGRVGFYLKLSDPDGAVSDVVGNLDGDSETEDEPAWELPSGTTEDGARTSLMRRYDRDTHVPLDGRISENWVSASALQLSVMTYWGWRTDIGNPGYQGEGALPVTLAHFRAERLDTDVVVIEWTTASELDNAGFNILRSQSKEDPYVKVNQALITGAGTTSERHAYIYRDSGTQPNIAYFYQIEDVSFSGVRQRLATARMRGYVSASDKLTTTWGGLKTRH